MYVANTAILDVRIFIRRYHFRLWVFASTSENFYYWHWRVLPKVSQGKWWQDLLKPCSIILRFVLTNHILMINHMIYCRLAHLTVVFKKTCWFSAVYYRIWLEGYIRFIRFFSFAKGQQTFKIKPVNICSQDHPRR